MSNNRHHSIENRGPLQDSLQTVDDIVCMPALAWVPLSDAAAAKLADLAHTEGIRVEELAGRILTAYVNRSSARRKSQPVAVEKKENVHDLLAALEQSIERHWKEHPDQRTGVENIIVASLTLIREVNNGGFDQYFRNSSARWATFAPDALLHVAHKDAARIAKRAVRAVGSWKTLEEFGERLSRPNSRRDEILNECDIAFYQIMGLEERVLEYARNHPNGLLRR